MAEKSYNEIPNLQEDWGLDPRNGLKYSGRSVQNFIKKGIKTAQDAYNEKAGDFIFDSQSNTLLVFRNTEEKELWLETNDSSLVKETVPFNFTGVQNQVKVLNGMASGDLYFTTQTKEAKITCSFISQEKGITDSNWNDVNEDFFVSVFVDKGNTGVFEKIVNEQSILNGQQFTFDIKPSIATGSNRVRVIAVGKETGASGSFTYTVNLTTMYLAPSNFTWYLPFVEGKQYNLGGLNIGGNLQKVLRIRVTKEETYIKDYEVNIGDNIYVTNAYTYSGLEFPTAGSGVYNVEMWLDANGLTSEHLSYNIICVAKQDESTAQIVSVSDNPDKILNFAENKLFEYCIYNGGLTTGSPTISLDVIVNTNANNIKTETLVNVPTGQALNYTTSIEVEVAESKMQLSATMSYGNTQQVVYPIDNSKSHPATSESVFYINPSQRNNAQIDREQIVNAINSEHYNAEWTNMAWVDGTDGWTVDDEGRKCLLIPAFSRCNIAYQPIADNRTPFTMEFLFKVKNASDYDDPIISISEGDDSFAEDEYDYDIQMKSGSYIAPDNSGLLSNASYEYSVPIFLAKGESIHFNTTGYGFVAVTETNESGTSYNAIINITAEQTGNNTTSFVSDITYTATKDIWIKICRKTVGIANPILYIKRYIDIPSNTDSNFNGIRITPKNICLHSINLKDSSLQDYNLLDEKIMDVIVTVIPNYKTNYGNLAQIYCNGVKVRSFEFSSISEWNTKSNIILGNDTCDLYFYKMYVYRKGFDKTDAMRNSINALPNVEKREEMYNRLLSVTDDSYNLSYDTCVKNGYNTMVIEMLNGKEIPSLLNQEEGLLCNLNINIHNLIEGELDEEMRDLLCGMNIVNQVIEGQGTTAMTYGRWNFRWKLDGTYGKRRITAKKNVASSSHDNKMGGTRAFNWLHEMCVGENEAGADVTVLQYPVFGFQKVLQEDGKTYVYRPIGLYTIGADKGDKKTFGYNNKTYEDTLIHMEGSDHTPKSVGFDYPWSGLKYSSKKDVESLGAVVSSDGSIVAAWEVGAAGQYETDSKVDESNIQKMLDDEFKPAYDVAYKNSPFIMCVSESVSDMNADIEGWQNRTDEYGEYYSAYEFFNKSNGNVIYYNVMTKKYEEQTDFNLFDDLNLEASAFVSMTDREATEAVVTARKQRFVNEWGNYWHKDDTIFHYVFMLIFAATDNYKKNTYPYKFASLADGGKWRWRADDLDTIFDINNQGLAAKIYSVLVGDKTETGSVYRGDNSALWTLIRLTQGAEIKNMVHRIFDAMLSHPKSKGANTLEALVSFVRYFFWSFAQEYFPESAYNADAEWTYEDIWANKNAWKEVNPLSQALGGHYEAQQDWVQMRMLFLSSYYNYGAFAASGYNDTSTGSMVYGGAAAHTYHITPAIDMNPTIIRGSTEIITNGERVKANETVPLTVSNTTGADTRIYVQGLDWIKDIGDLSQLTVSAGNPTLNISSKRLQGLKIGDEDASKIPSSGTIKGLEFGECPSMTVVDARNVGTLTGTVDLTRLPRLKEAYLGGTDVKVLRLKDGSKIGKLEIPDSLTTLKLKDLKFISFNEKDIEFDFILGKYINTSGAVGSLVDYKETADSNFKYAIVECKKNMQVTISGTGGSTHRLWCFVDGQSRIISNAAAALTVSNLVLTPPDGALKLIIGFNTRNYYSVEGSYKEATIFYNTLKNISTLQVENSNVDGFDLMKKAYNEVGSRLGQIRVVGFEKDGDATDLSMLSNMVNDKNASGEAHTFTGIDSEGNVTEHPVIEGTINIPTPVYEDDVNILKEAYGNALVMNFGGYYIRFYDPAVLTVLLANGVGDGIGVTYDDVSKVDDIKTWFAKNTAITSFNELQKFSSLAQIGSFSNTSNYRDGFNSCENLVSIVLPNNVETIGHYAFGNCYKLSMDLPQSIKSLGAGSFFRMGRDAENGFIVNLPNLEKITSRTVDVLSATYYTFMNSGVKRIESLGKVTSLLGQGYIENDEVYAMFSYCDKLTYANIDNVVNIGTYTFYRCTSLERVDSKSLANIGNYAFMRDSMLSEIDLSNVETIGTRAFEFSGVRCLNSPNLKSISTGAFRKSDIEEVLNLGSITKLPSEYIYVETNSHEYAGVFRECSKLERISLPASLREIGHYTFYNCTALQIDELNLPNLETLGQYAFYGVKIKKMILGKDGGSLTLPVGTNSTKNYGDKTVLESVEIRSLVDIPEYSFYLYTALKNASIDNATTIGRSAFYSCPITDISMDNVESIGVAAFWKTQIQTLRLPKLKTIGAASFAKTELVEVLDLGEITILPMQNMSLDEGAWVNWGVFRECTKLEKVIIPSSVEDIQSGSFYGCTSLKNVTIPTSIKKIGTHAFYKTDLDGFDANFPNLEEIGSYVFYKSKIKTVSNLGKITTLSYSHTSLDSGWADYGTFAECPSLESVILPETLQTIVNGSFFNCTALLTINIPNSVTTIGVNAFQNCSNIRYTNNEAFKNVESISTKAFFHSGFDGQDLHFKKCAGSINSHTFGYCKCRSIVLGKVVSVSGGGGDDYNPLHRMPNLEYCLFGDTLTSFGQNNFMECPKLTALIFCSTTPPTLGGAIQNNNCSIYVPDESVTAYKEASVWVNYSTRIKPISQLQMDNPDLHEEIGGYL